MRARPRGGCTVVDERTGGVLVECNRTAYLTAETRLRLHGRDVDGAGVRGAAACR